MKDTIKIDAVRALVVEPAGNFVLVHVMAAGLRMYSQALTPDQAAVMAQALERTAHHCETARASA